MAVCDNIFTCFNLQLFVLKCCATDVSFIINDRGTEREEFGAQI